MLSDKIGTFLTIGWTQGFWEIHFDQLKHHGRGLAKIPLTAQSDCDVIRYHPHYHWLKVNLDHMLKLWRQLCSKQQTLSKFIQPKKINKFMKLSKQCAPEYQSLIRPKKKGFWSKGFPNNFFSLVPTSTATTSTSTTRCKQLLWSKGDACFLAVHFGGLVFLAFLLMRKWQRKKLEKNKKTLKSHNFWRNSRLRGGVHFFLTNYLDRLFVDLKKILGAS